MSPGPDTTRQAPGLDPAGDKKPQQTATCETRGDTRSSPETVQFMQALPPSEISNGGGCIARLYCDRIYCTLKHQCNSLVRVLYADKARSICLFVFTACSLRIPTYLIPAAWAAMATSMTGTPTIPNMYSTFYRDTNEPPMTWARLKSASLSLNI